MRIANGIWPSAPFTHSAVLRVGGGVPACSLVNRRLQKDLLADRFPSLACLPIDANSRYPRPLTPSLMFRVKNKVLTKTRLRELLAPKGESRYYFRVYDINNEGWRAVREASRPAMAGLADIMDEAYIHRLLPDSGQVIQVEDGIRDVSGLKSLLGFALWYAHYSDRLTAPGVSDAG